MSNPCEHIDPFTVIGTFRKAHAPERHTFLAHVVAPNPALACRAAAGGIKYVLEVRVSVKTELVLHGHIDPVDETPRAFTETALCEKETDQRCIRWFADSAKVEL